MLELNQQEHKAVNQKWAIFILISLRHEKRLSYQKIRVISQIPNSTLSIRLNDLVKYRFLEKFVYGSISKPHNTDYKITEFGLQYLNNMLPNNLL